jgi:Concanavalin A-like lectin/glucanases superfamily
MVGVLVAAAIVFGAGESAGAATLKANYQLQGNLASAVAGAPELTSLGAGNRFVFETVDGVRRQVLRFPKGNGLALSTAGLVDPRSYSVALLFRLDDLERFRRILDFSNSTSDNGFYDYSGNAVIYGSDGGPTRGGIVFDESYAQVVFTSAPATDSSQRVVAYVNGAEVVAATASKDFDLSPGTLRLFQDNTSGPAGGEESAGALACLLVYDGVLSADEVDQLAAEPALCPAPRPTPRQAKAFATGKPKLRNSDRPGRSPLVDTGLTVRCPIGAPPCSVRARVDLARSSKRALGTRLSRLGAGRFFLQGGATAKVLVRLSRSGSRVLRDVGSVKVRTSVRITVPGGRAASAGQAGRIEAPQLPAYRPGLYTGTTSQGLPIFISVGRTSIGSVFLRWRARCADGKVRTNAISFRGERIRRGRFSFRRTLETGGTVRISGRIKGVHASGTLSRVGTSAFGTKCAAKGIGWRVRASGIETTSSR